MCSVDGCEREAYCRCFCTTHYQRWRKHGDPTVVQKPRRYRWQDNPRWTGDRPGYATSHWRIRKIKGRAAEQPCTACAGPAREWAYDGTDPDELVSPEGYRYSTQPDHYRAMCVACHRRFDDNPLTGADVIGS